MNRSTLEFIKSIINGKAVSFPVTVIENSNEDKFLTSHPMFHKAMIKTHDNFKNIKDNRDEEE